MSDDQVGCEWVSVSSGTGLPWMSRTKAVKRLCVFQIIVMILKLNTVVGDDSYLTVKTMLITATVH